MEEKKTNFFRTLGLAFQPWKYDEVPELHGWRVTKYFLLLVMFAFITCLVIFMPKLYVDVSNQFDRFNELSVDFNTSMKGPVYLPYGTPLLSIDTRDKPIKHSGELLLMTEDNFFVKKPFWLGTEKIDSGDFKDLLANEGMVVAFILLMLPSLLLLFYLYYLLKTFLIIFIAAVLGLIITRLMKFDISFADSLKVGVMAATPMIIIDFIRFPFGLFIYWAQYGVFVLFFILGAVKAGEFMTSEKEHSSHRIIRKRK